MADNQVIIMSGVSGSGKSSYAEQLLQASQGVKVSVDHFFTWEDGSYHFDAAHLTEAHATCFRRFIGFCQTDISCIVVDNLNLTVEEMSPYVLGAEAFGYRVQILTLMTTWDNLRVMARRNLHGVSLETIEKQYTTLKKRRPLLWWQETTVEADISVWE